MKAKVRQEIIDEGDSIFVLAIMLDGKLPPQEIELPDDLLLSEFEAFTPDAWDSEEYQEEWKVILILPEHPYCIYIGASCDFDLEG